MYNYSCKHVFNILLQNKTSRANAVNIGDPALTRTVKELTVKATTHSTDNLSPEQKSGDPNGFNLQLSADIDEARYNVELLKQTIIENAESLLYWEARLQTLENQVPQINRYLIGQLRNVLASIE